MAKPKTAGELRRLKDLAHIAWGGCSPSRPTEYARAQKRYYDLCKLYQDAHAAEQARRIAYLSDPERMARMTARGHDIPAMIAKIKAEV